MARPIKTGLDYFPLNIDFFDDEKIVCLESEFGIKGSMIAIRLLCAIYRNGYFVEWTELLRAKLIRQLPGVSGELFDQVLNRLVRWGFFCASLFDSDKVLTSAAIQHRYFEAIRKRTPRAKYPYLIVSAPKTGVSAPKTGVSSVGNQQIKVNKKISPDGDIKKSPPSSGLIVELISFEESVKELEGSGIWIEEMAKHLHMSVGDVMPLYSGAFRQSCIRMGKPERRTLQEYKSHFFNWSSQQKYSSANVTTSTNHSGRRSARPSDKLPVEPGCGLKRRPSH